MVVDPNVTYSEILNQLVHNISPLPYLIYILIVIAIIVLGQKNGVPMEIMIVMGVLLFASMITLNAVFKPLTYVLIILLVGAIVFMYARLGKEGE